MPSACPSCGTEGKNHGEGCTYESRLDPDAILTEASDLVSDPEKYEAWLKLSMAAHLVRLDREARAGDVKAAQAFRIGALEVLEVLSAEEDERESAGPPKGASAQRGGRTTAAARAIARAVGVTPEGMAGGKGRGRKPHRDDEGRAGSGEPDQAVPDSPAPDRSDR